MAAPDMDVIKEIPGYKVILKAVLKSQIQQLVEQLASHTDEESVILTASVSDGTLSHLGSDSGKFFLSDHEDIKSQFLGFCLKRHHKKKQEQDREEELQRMQQFSPRHMAPRPPMRYPSPRQNVHPVSLSRAHPGSHVRPQGVRHEPYSVPRPRRVNMNPGPIPSSAPIPSSISPIKTNNQIIKIEPDGEGSNQSAGDASTPKQTEGSSSQPTSPSNVQTSTIEKAENLDDSSSSTIPNEASEMKFSDTQPAEGLGLDSDLSNLISGEQSGNPNPSSSATQGSELDPNVSVKLEAISENDMELEITGVEPGPALNTSQDMSWGANTSMGYDPLALGATGSPSDMPGQEGYSHVTELPPLLDQSKQRIESNKSSSKLGQFRCEICGGRFNFKQNLRRHERMHTGEKSHKCDLCDYRSSRTDHLKNHYIQHFNQIPDLELN